MRGQKCLQGDISLVPHIEEDGPTAPIPSFPTFIAHKVALLEMCLVLRSGRLRSSARVISLPVQQGRETLRDATFSYTEE